MRIANIIIFHKDPGSIERLINALQHPNFDFYLHLDKKVDIRPFAYLADLPNTRFIINRKVVHWGGFSQLEALLASLEQIFNGDISYDFVNLLSGQDYPIKPVSEINNILSDSIGKSFMITETPPSPWWDEAMVRITDYHLSDYDFRGRYRLGIALSKLLPKRRFPLPLQLYGGPYASYWILSFDATMYIYFILHRNESIKLFFKHTWAPDEFLIHTLLMNSHFRGSILNENHHYMDRSQGGAHPKTLTKEDFDLLQQSKIMFARKFDRRIDADILDMIDEKLLFRAN
ncbi:Core-2/I-Branching enzyme [Chitinophaga sp. CF118]|uniref:beta-1,6-N-acetylglucosaminyltransferase n=1 Tax=Chitinophaga sp. CF118 TaxID=1884367 RepID=UPI0008DFB4FB|nr:beta-1,6-N-acetylglucosaminyltransferase [Chitinophaga sp. CF118]SFE51188.1 Core-2/I-Branching enzyme [Chitinophaga sp. CF118]